MKKVAIVYFLFIVIAKAQIVKFIPQTLTAEDSVEIIYDANQGTQALMGVTSVYIHTGVVTTNTNSPTGNDWKYVVGNWGKDDGIGKMSKVTGTTDQWRIKLTPSIRSYYKVPAGESIYKLGMVFRNADGSKEGKGIRGDFAGGTVIDNGDIFLNISSIPYISILSPTESNIFLKNGDSIRFVATASTDATSLTLSLKEDDGIFQQVLSLNNTRSIRFSKYISHSTKITFKTETRFGETTIHNMKDFFIHVRTSSIIEALPPNIKNGINYNASDSTSVILVLQAPKKQFVYVVGDFTNWQVEDNFLMKQTPDSQYFWLEITSLQPKKEYAYQYWVDGTIKIGDPYADKVADPNNDKYTFDSLQILKIPTEVGIASVLQTGQAPFQWGESENNWVRPKKEELIIYELLIRDFVKQHSYKALLDTLPYLKKLGVNAIELMPIMEFEGNESWGYNPIYHMAVDKYYGTNNELKTFIQEAHKQGFAVLLDMVLNHAFGQSPLVRMYWDTQNNKPARNSPWFNTDAPHPYNVGYDFNHESPYTQSFVDDVNTYWLKEFHFDGYRFDLTKGFTNTTSTEQTASNYDASRISILKRMALKIFEHTPNAYVILEHFAEEREEKELSDAGMLLWANGSYSYGDILLGKTSANISFVNNKTKVSYMESHDEERLMYKAMNSTEGNATYFLKNKHIALNRVKALASFFYTVPGPKMMWQFQELGYDISINFNGRLGNKPYPWGNEGLGYYEDNERQKLFKVHSAIINLVKEYKTAFTEGKFTWTFTNDPQTTEVKHASIVIEHPSLSVVIVANFTTQEVTARIPILSQTATWYDFFFKDINTTPFTANEPIKLYPGEFHIFVDRRVNFPEAGLVTLFKPLVTVEPSQFTPKDSVLLTFQPIYSPDRWTLDGEKCYMVAGVVISPTGNKLEYIKGTENRDDGIGLMATLKTSPIKYSILFKPREYFQVPTNIPIYKIGLFFRNADGSKIAKGIYGDTIFLKVSSEGKIVTVEPENFGPNTEIKIIFDALVANNDGTAGLVNARKVYMHSGIITTSAQGTSWEHVVGNWGTDDNIGQMTAVPNELNKWQITITPRNYFTAVPPTANWFRIGMVFRNEDGSARGKDEGASDIFVNFHQNTIINTTPLITLVEEKHIDNTVHIFPNPTKKKIFLQLEDNSFFSTQSIDFWDINGVYIKTNILIVNNTIEMDISHLKKGIYFVSITLNDRYTIKKILIE
ncbi:MAG: alpha-amylase family glycosyl hydrolase [Chitinophagaceae bacterium]|nr:alpha-amylase family glycosyl hydrolase [Chitinophagaceae bacterium]